MVLAHNAEMWEITPSFAPLLDIPETHAADLSEFVPDFTFRLIQLAGLEFEAIRGTPAGILTLRVMKAERLARLLDEAVWDEALFLRVPQEIIELLIRYILNADIDKAAFDHRASTVSNAEIQKTAMTIAQQYRQEGRQEGHQQGHQEGRMANLQENIIEALGIRFGEVPQGLREAIVAVHEESGLRVLLRTAIQAASLEDFAHSL